MPTRRQPFSLSKWYLDVITEDGGVAILYAARLRWGLLRVSYASALLDSPAGARHEETTIRGVVRPRRRDEGISWHNDPLDVRGAWRPVARPFHHTLLRNASGVVQFACLAPLAVAEVRCGEKVVRGLGYVEHLRLSILPWKLPLRTLRWARHTSARHSLVSIVWEGREPRRWVWLDGVEQRHAEVSDDRIVGLAGNASLTIESGRVARDRRIRDILPEGLPALAGLIAGRLARLREVKRISRSCLAAAESREDHGWTLHEVVAW